MTYPWLEWLRPSLRLTYRAILHRSETDAREVWVASQAGADDWTADGKPLDPTAYVLRYTTGNGVEPTVHADIGAAKAAAAAALRMMGHL